MTPNADGPAPGGEVRALLEHAFQIDVTTDPRGTVITVSGELDVASSPVLERTLARLQDVGLVVVDLRGVTFIDSTGLGVLVKAHQLAQERGHRLGLVRGGGQVDRLLKLTGLDAELLFGASSEQLLGAR